MFKSLVLKLHLKSSKRSSDIPYLFLITDSIRLSELNTVLQPIFISPLFGVKLPDRQFNNVLLPAPEGPRNTVIPLHVFPETDRENSPRVIIKSNNIVKSRLYVLIFLRPFWARRL